MTDPIFKGILYTWNFSIMNKDMFNIRLKTESAEITFKDITEKESISFTDNRRFNYYIWNNSEYIIMINSNVSKNRLRITIEFVQR